MSSRISQAAYELEFTKLFEQQFARLEKVDQKRVYHKIQELKLNLFRHKALTGPFEGCFRIRIGNLRVIYMPVKSEKKVFLIDVDVRKRVYKKNISEIITQIYEQTPSRK